MQKMKHRIQLFPDGSGPRRLDVQKVIVHPGEVRNLYTIIKLLYIFVTDKQLAGVGQK